jgi:tetratricopeptide (TPR) repeat protein
MLRAVVQTAGGLLLAMQSLVVAEAAFAACDFPSFKVDPAGTVNACSTMLAQNDLPQSERIEAHKLRARSLHRQGFLDHAIKEFDELLKLAPNDPEAMVRRGWTAFDKRNYEYAIELARRAIKQKPDYPEGYHLLAAVKLTKREDFSEAKTALDTAIRLNPNDAILYVQRYGLFLNWGLNAEALAALDDALAAPGDDLDWQNGRLQGIKMPVRTEVMIRRAWLLAELGRLDDAKAAFDSYVQRSPSALAYAYRAAYHADHLNFEQAQRDLDMARTYEPDFWLINRTQGELFLAEKKYAEALACFNRLMQQIEWSSRLYWWRSRALRGLDRIDEAKRDALIAMSDHNFAKIKMPRLVELGYYQPPAPGMEKAALRDAVQACILDERCW